MERSGVGPDPHRHWRYDTTMLGLDCLDCREPGWLVLCSACRRAHDEEYSTLLEQRRADAREKGSHDDQA